MDDKLKKNFLLRYMKSMKKKTEVESQKKIETDLKQKETNSVVHNEDEKLTK